MIILNIVDKIKSIIVNQGIKQTFLANKIGLSKDSFSKSLSGKRTFKTDEVFKLADILNIDLNQFKAEA